MGRRLRFTVEFVEGAFFGHRPPLVSPLFKLNLIKLLAVFWLLLIGTSRGSAPVLFRLQNLYLKKEAIGFIYLTSGR